MDLDVAAHGGQAQHEEAAHEGREVLLAAGVLEAQGELADPRDAGGDEPAEHCSQLTRRLGDGNVPLRPRSATETPAWLNMSSMRRVRTRLPLRAKERRVSAAMRLQGRGNFCARHELRQRLLSTSLVASETPNA